MEQLLTIVIAKYNYWAFIALLMVGLYAMIVKKNLVKKIVGMNIVQTAIILFFISVSAKKNATLPILLHHHGHESTTLPSAYINPLPHVLMLTAIVVAVATFGVAIALAIRVHGQYNTLDEDDIRAKLTENERI